MNRIFKFAIITICLLLTACNAGSELTEKNSSIAAADFKFISSAVPLSFASNNSIDAETQRKVLKYDDIRAIWLSYIDISPMLTGKTEQEFRASFDDACKMISELGCNTIFVHVRPFGDALYKSELYPASRLITGTAGKQGDFDPLEIMVETAHKYKLSVHGWINPLRLESAEHFDKYDSKLLTKQWYDSKNGYVCSVSGDKHLWLNPGYSEVRQLIADGAAEIVKNYNVDGIHFDDYFYPTTDESFDKACFAKLNEKKSLSVWRLDNISDMVSRIYKSVKAIDKELCVGVSPQGNIDNNYRYMYADVKKWGSESGYVDYICPQIYFGYNNPIKPFLSTLKEWESVVNKAYVSLCIGLAVYKINSQETEFVQTNGIIAKQIGDIYSLKCCKGFSLYAYNDLFSDSERARQELDSIKRQLESIKK